MEKDKIVKQVFDNYTIAITYFKERKTDTERIKTAYIVRNQTKSIVTN